MSHSSKHNLLLNRAFQYLGVILIVAAMGGGYWYWKQAQAGANIKTPSNSGLKAHWQFDEATGSSAADSSGNNNTGTLQNSPARVEGKKNRAITFNGSNQYVSIPDSGSINFGTAVTVSAWVKGDSWADADTNAVYIKYLAHYMTVNTSGNVGVYGYGKSPVGYHHSNQALKTGIWYNIAVTIDASEFRIYIDGKLDKTVSATGTLSTSVGQTATIGAEPGGGSRHFNGSIDEVRVYDRALSMGEIASSYAETKLDYSFENSLEQGLVGYWKLDDASGTSATDASGNANTGTLTNGPTWTTGQIGGGVNFDGTNDSIGMSSAATTATDNYTMTAWIYPANLNQLSAAILNGLDDGVTGTQRGYAIGLGNGAGLAGGKLQGLLSNVAWLDSGYTFPAANAWYHIVMLRGAGTTKFYVNGVQTPNTFATAPGTPNNGFSIGSMTGIRYFNGSIDEVRVYNRALSAEEVTKLYKTTTPDDPDTGLVGYWPFDGPDISGTTAFDRSGKGNNGTLTNGPTITEGRSGQALSFDGSNDYLDAGSGSSLRMSGAFSMSFWMYAQGSSADAYIAGTGSTNLEGYSCTHHNGATVYCYIQSGTNSVSAPVANNSWSHITVTWDGTTGTSGKKIYVDGVLASQGASSQSALSSWGNFRVGEIASNNRTRFNGKVDDLRVYNRALSASEIWNLYQAGAADKVNSADSQIDPLEKGMVVYWKLDDASGTSASDASGNANTGTLTNGPTWTAGQIGGAVDFDGTNDYINGGNIFNFTSSDFSIGYWMKLDSLSTNEAGQGPVPIFKGQYQVNGYYSQVNASGGISFLTNQSGTNQTTTSVASVIETTSWHHVVYARRGSSIRIYVDGLDKTGTAATHINPASSSDSFIAGYYNNGDQIYMNGKIDEVRVYNRALSADEVAKLYKTTAPDNPDTGLVGYWPFNGSDLSGTTAYDRSGKSNNGTLTNGPTVTEGKIGQGLSLDGDDYVDAGSATNLDDIFSGGGSIAAWTKPVSWLGTKNIVEKSGTINGFHLYQTGPPNSGYTQVRFQRMFGTTLGRWASPQDVFNVGEWFHVVVTYDDSSVSNDPSLYVNGVSQSISETSVPSGSYLSDAASNLRIGDTTGSSKASIDEVRIYNRILSASEIQALYNAGR